MALLKKFSPYVVVTVAASCLITVIMHLWKVNLGIPFVNSGDALWTSMMVKGLKDNPWIFNNRFVGMPFGLQTYDWLSSDNLFYLIIKY